MALNLTPGTTIWLEDGAIVIGGANSDAETYKLKVTGDASFSGDVHTGRVFNAIYNDYAEFIEKSEKAIAGQVVVMTKDGLVPSKKRGDKAAVGVCSDTYGHALGAEDKENKIPVGLAGRVKVWIREKVEIGDLLVSDKYGFASVKRVTDRKGTIIGKALQAKDTSFPERISMLIMLA